MKQNSQNNLTRSEKILLYLYEAGNNEMAKIRFEDIVVGLFKKYPHEFHLKGHPEYPDSGDMVHKPLYDSKKKGYVNASNKIFSLTERGLEYAKTLAQKPPLQDISENRLSRSTETEVSRIKKLEGFFLFSEGKNEKLSDNDLYGYLGVTVRTPKNAFVGRMETIKETIDELKKHKDDGSFNMIVSYHKFLMSKFEDIIIYFTKN
ncbi:MAG: hypothetical protein KBC26_00560 [Candidatus Pacebacteria bacterium]|nr:hypothetical protein [Candidatus Paceibacterota bacterium]